MHDVACEFSAQEGCAETIGANVLKPKTNDRVPSTDDTQQMYLHNLITIMCKEFRGSSTPLGFPINNNLVPRVLSLP